MSRRPVSLPSGRPYLLPAVPCDAPEGRSVPDSLAFTRLVREVARAAHAAGLLVPGFRDAPAGAVRHVRRRVGQHPVVVIPTVGRSLEAQHQDAVAGVVAVNPRAESGAVEHFLWAVGNPPQTEGPPMERSARQCAGRPPSPHAA